MIRKDPTKRFSDRVENYVKYRPSYPPKVVDELLAKGVITTNSVIADIGSGTGKFSELLVKKGVKVFGIEPNEDMRKAGENFLSSYSIFQSLSGTAEATNLPEKSIDVITVAQAFHWFKIAETQKEFARILKPNGYIVLIWNDRDSEDAFQKEYDRLIIEYCPEYRLNDHRNISYHDLEIFYKTDEITKFECAYSQLFDFESLQGRLESSSYTPTRGEENYQPMIIKLKELHNKYQENGKVKFAYKTEMSYGIPNFL